MKYRVEAYPHNDLLNLAFYNLENIKTKEEDPNAEGIGLDCLNAIIAMAFSVEAFVNFIGSGHVENWNEREKYHKKLKAICGIAGLEFNEDVEPFNTLKKLKFLRDDIAHGKPIEKEVEYPVGTPAELKKEMEQPWDTNCNPEFVKIAFDCVLNFESDMLNVLGIDPALTRTSTVSL